MAYTKPPYHLLPPEVDSARAPTSAGQHPHTVRSHAENESIGPHYERQGADGRYQTYEQGSHPMGAADPGPSAPPQDNTNFWLGVLGVAVAGAALYVASKKNEEARVNPASQPETGTASLPPQIVVVPSAGQPIQGLLPAPASPEPVKTKRRRVTTQAHEPGTGRFGSSGTAKPRIEGED